jgi:hypothetical protein
MTLYRKQRRVSPLLVGGLVVLGLTAVGVVWFVATGIGRAQTSDPRAQARANALEVAQGLELVSIEYPKVLRGEPSGAPGALSRAQAVFNSARPELAKIDPATTDSVGAALTTLAQKVSAHAPTDDVSALADQTRAKLIGLSKP